MKKKQFKIIITFFLVFMLFLMFNKCFADPAKINTSINIGTHDAQGSQEVGNKIFGIVRVIGILVSVGALSLIGIRYMLSSVEEKAEKKKALVYYVIGAVLVFGISNFAQFFYNFIKDAFN